MIRDVLDVALVLTDALARATAGEANADEPRKTAFAAVYPAHATFLVRTVEGKRFKVTVQEDG